MYLLSLPTKNLETLFSSLIYDILIVEVVKRILLIDMKRHKLIMVK